jgi:TRAP-type C4-dicarboxylate transport system substrate-binding protein
LLGAAPITSNSGEVYGSLNRGLAQGVASTLPGTEIFKTSEVAKYHVDVHLGDSFAYLFFNIASYDRLPDKAKQLIERESGESLSLQMGKIADEEDERVKALYRAGKDQVIEDLAPAEMERMRQLLNPFVDKWVQQTPNGAAVLAAYRDLVKEIDARK